MDLMNEGTQRMKRILALLGVLFALAMTSIAWASPNVTESAPVPKTTVVHTWIKHPHSERVVKHFVPPADPSPSYVENVIIPYEAARWGGGSLADRIECESGFDPQATNGTYNGLIQTSPAFWYGAGAWPSVVAEHDRGVVLKSKRRVARGVYRVRLWSNGEKTFNRIRVQHVRRVVIRKGQIPKDATEWNAWAAVRVGQRAVAGAGPTTYWACTHFSTGHY